MIIFLKCAERINLYNNVIIVKVLLGLNLTDNNIFGLYDAFLCIREESLCTYNAYVSSN